MPNNSSQTNELRLASYCPVCEARSNGMNAQMLAEAGDTHLLHVQCRKCQNAFLSLVLVNTVGATSVGLFTDLAFEDVERFRSARPISVNDVIAVHERLKTGAVKVVFEQKRTPAPRVRAKHTVKKVQK